MEAVKSLGNRWPALGTLVLADRAVTAEQLEQALVKPRDRPDHALVRPCSPRGS